LESSRSYGKAHVFPSEHNANPRKSAETAEMTQNNYTIVISNQGGIGMDSKKNYKITNRPAAVSPSVDILSDKPIDLHLI
jgi:hypothetical protein